MKAKLPEQYITYSNRFSLTSIIHSITKISLDMFKLDDKSKINNVYLRKRYKVIVDKKNIVGEVSLIQWGLFEALYNIIINHHNASVSVISEDESFYLLSLFNLYQHEKEKKVIKKTKNETFLRLYAILGEQKKFQEVFKISEVFSRESYILENISKVKDIKYKHNIDIESEIQSVFNINTFKLKYILFLIVAYFSTIANAFFDADEFCNFSNLCSREEIIKVLDYYSVSVEQLKGTNLDRQIFYSKPLIKIKNAYFSVNPILLFLVFSNSQYWLIRDKFKKENSTAFIEEFGLYFENYIKEVLTNCVGISNFNRVDENRDEKRADWMITLDNHTFLVEQKSALSMIGIKQQIPNIEELKKYMKKCWGKAIRQLNATENALNLETPIKIILVYDDYFKAECLDELFKIDETLKDDGRFWLLNTEEFEMLMFLYKKDPTLFFKIVEEKTIDEANKSWQGREVYQYLSKYGIKQNEYLINYGIIKKFEDIENFFISGEQNA